MPYVVLERRIHLFNIGTRRQHEIAEISPHRPLIQPAHINVVKHGQRLHQRRILGHQRRLGAKALIEKTEQGGFPCSAFSDERNSLTGFDTQREPAKNLFAVIAGRFVFELKQGHQSIRPISLAVSLIGA